MSAPRFITSALVWLLLTANAAGVAAANGAASDWRLADAVRSGSLNRIQALLDQGANPNSRDRSGTPALVWAAAQSQTDTLRQLLSAGADPAQSDRNGVTALMWAAWNGDTSTIETLLDAGADPNTSDRYGFTALWVGSYNSSGDSAFAVPLLEAGAKPDSSGPDGLTPLMLCAQRGQHELGHKLLQAGARVDAGDRLKRSALHHALLQGHTALLPALLRAGDKAALNRADAIGLTPLLIAISQSNPALVNTLLEAGADANGGDGPSPLALSVSTSLCRGQISESLLQHGADPSGRDHHGKPALLLAVNQGCQGLVDRLLEAGADINSQDPGGNGVLIGAITSGQLRLTRVLLERGANPDTNASVTGAQPSPIIALLEKNRPGSALLRALLKAGAKADATDARGTPALVLAARAGNQQAVALLSTAVSNVDASDSSGMTALMVAAKTGHRAIVDLLLQAGADPQRRDTMFSESALNIARMAGHSEIEDLLRQHRQTAPTTNTPATIEAPLTARAH